jgi:hypothetical protein
MGTGVRYQRHACASAKSGDDLSRTCLGDLSDLPGAAECEAVRPGGSVGRRRPGIRRAARAYAVDRWPKSSTAQNPNCLEMVGGIEPGPDAYKTLSPQL